MYTFLLRMTDTMTSQNINLSTWDTLYSTADKTLKRENSNYEITVIFTISLCNNSPIIIVQLE
jgi:hypothetical protein